ncbi:polyphenol oxidase family protein [Candidatus Daviesbacteria bacterium]|nr:polyphenol oxidase family protein [Candidatus Daviesbacteria bacterium]
MSIYYGSPKKALANREKFFKKIKINPKKLAEVKQIHGNKVIKIDNVPLEIIEADGLITNKDIYLMIKVADCMAISFYDKAHKAIGLIHVGYRGLDNGIIKKAIKSLEKNYKTNPKALIVKFGPSIGPCHYRLDIWKEAEKQLIKTGVLPENIDNPKICTYENKNYFSHRRSVDKNQPEGRFVTIFGL